MLKIHFLLFIVGLMLSEKAYANTSIDIKCSGVLNHFENINTDNYHAKMQVTVILMKNKSGHITLNGRISSSTTVYTLSRTIDYTYQYNNNDFGIYNMTFTRVNSAGVDNVPASIFEKYMSLFSLNKSKLIRINTLPSENLLISSAFGPLFICVPQ